MAGEGQLSTKTMAAAYTVTIEGVKRTREQVAQLDRAITQLRQAQYSPLAGIGTVAQATLAAGQRGGRDLLVHKIDALEGRVQKATEVAMSAAMAKARRAQVQALNAAETKTGRSGKPAGRNSAGRNVTGNMIHAIGTNIETMRLPGATQITGWHGWGTEVRQEKPGRYIATQEKGNKGTSTRLGSPAAVEAKERFEEGKVGSRMPIMPANSLGFAIPIAREFLKAELDKLR